MEDELQGARCTGAPLQVDGNIITAKGPACAIPFALKIVETLKDRTVAEKVRDSMQVYWSLT
jgi:4-methyl-5(b-hydroxyethyl)-thiazole monophosphate biosynthesis